MTTKKIPLRDLHEMREDERIALIVHRVLEHKEAVGILVDVEDGSHEKGDRQIAKVKKLAPQVTVLARFDGPVEGVELIRILCYTTQHVAGVFHSDVL